MEIVMVLASIAPNAERTDGSISPTLMARAGTGGGQLPIVILRGEDDESNGRCRMNSEKPWNTKSCALKISGGVRPNAVRVDRSNAWCFGFMRGVSEKAGGMGEHCEQSPTLSSGDVPLVAIGVDLYNQSLTGTVSKTMNSIRSDSDHVPCVLIQETDDERANCVRERPNNQD